MPRFCSHCGTALTVEGAKFCAHCGNPQSSGPVAAAAPARAPEKPREETLFDGEAVTVTTHRLITPGQTYAISNITSITSTKQTDYAGLAFLLIGLGIAFIGFANAEIEGMRVVTGFGLVCALIGLFLLTTAGATYHIVLRNSGGEVKAFTSRDAELINDVIVALNQAIIRRG